MTMFSQDGMTRSLQGVLLFCLAICGSASATTPWTDAQLQHYARYSDFAAFGDHAIRRRDCTPGELIERVDVEGSFLWSQEVRRTVMSLVCPDRKFLLLYRHDSDGLSFLSHSSEGKWQRCGRVSGCEETVIHRAESKLVGETAADFQQWKELRALKRRDQACEQARRDFEICKAQCEADRTLVMTNCHLHCARAC